MAFILPFPSHDRQDPCAEHYAEKAEEKPACIHTQHRTRGGGPFTLLAVTFHLLIAQEERITYACGLFWLPSFRKAFTFRVNVFCLWSPSCLCLGSTYCCGGSCLYRVEICLLSLEVTSGYSSSMQPVTNNMPFMCMVTLAMHAAGRPLCLAPSYASFLHSFLLESGRRS